MLDGIKDAVKGLSLGHQPTNGEQRGSSSSSSTTTVVVGVDPVGSILGGGKEVGSYQVEGIG